MADGSNLSQSRPSAVLWVEERRHRSSPYRHYQLRIKDAARVHSEHAVPDFAFLQEDAPQQGPSSLLECGLEGCHPVKADIVESANIQQRLQV